MSLQTLQFSKGEAIRFGWSIAKSNVGFFIKLLLVLIGIGILFSIVQSTLQQTKIPILSLVALIVGLTSNIITQLILYKVSLSFVEGRRPSYSELLNMSLFPKFALASILYAISFLGAVILFVIPLVTFGIGGIFFSEVFRSYLFIILVLGVIIVVGLSYLSAYIAMKYQFFGYFIVALGKDIGPLESLRLSSKITRGIKMNLYVFSLLSGLIILLGALAIGVGLIWAIPTVGIAHAYIFKKLVSQTQSVPAPLPS